MRRGAQGVKRSGRVAGATRMHARRARLYSNLVNLAWMHARGAARGPRSRTVAQGRMR